MTRTKRKSGLKPVDATMLMELPSSALDMEMQTEDREIVPPNHVYTSWALSAREKALSCWNRTAEDANEAVNMMLTRNIPVV